jgi:hypothetical protein
VNCDEKFLDQHSQYQSGLCIVSSDLLVMFPTEGVMAKAMTFFVGTEVTIAARVKIP